MSAPNHNLNIQSYSLDEILGLFDLESYDITIDDLKTAKRKVLMLHPDKSRLDAKYFLFYKKAFDVIVQFFDNQNRQNRSVEQKDVQPKAKLESYKCLSKNLNLIYANAEFQPFISNSFDWLHLRSMLDHVHSPDLALMEAWRLLKPGGHLLIGISIEGSREGNNKIISKVIHESKQIIKVLLNLVGIKKWKKDVHVFHPTFKGLMKIIKDNGFIIEEEYAQPCWGGKVWYISARKISRIPGNL